MPSKLMLFVATDKLSNYRCEFIRMIRINPSLQTSLLKKTKRVMPAILSMKNPLKSNGIIFTFLLFCALQGFLMVLGLNQQLMPKKP